jgi:phage terminase large subunit GpA-like protein
VWSEKRFDSIEQMIVAAAEGVRPAIRMTVSEAATEYRYLKNVGSYEGPWLNETTPYLVEPMDELTNMLYSTVCFVGPAQCGKTDMFLNFLTYKVMCDPADMMLVQTVQATARDFSISRVDRLHRHSEKVGAKLLSSHADNVFDKQYQSGMLLRLTWPSINELSGRPVPFVWETDYDRMTQDVDGEGTPYMLGRARTTTFGRYGKTVVESSPGFPITDAQWVKKSPHEAPPTEGILAIYNAGDRRRWYWRCVNPKCRMSFEPNRSILRYPNSEDDIEAGELAHLVCPHCEHQYFESESSNAPSKRAMNQLFDNGGNAKWIKEGELWLPSGEVAGRPNRTNTASFWLMGMAATFSTWKDLVISLRQAEREYSETRSENTLKTVVNTKFGEAYLPKAQSLARLPEQLRSRARDYGHKVVPPGVRFLIATIDVQKNRFIVQVHGIGVDDIWIIDRYEVKYSKREQEDMPGQFQYVNAGAHSEDWRLLVTEVMTKTYPLMTDPDRHMAIWQTFSDSGGSEGVTGKAYDFVRWLRHGYKTEDGKPTEDADLEEIYPWFPHLSARFHLVKGASTPNHPRIKVDFPDSQRKDRHAGARGEIPVVFMNTNMLKDELDGILDRTEPGGRICFPDWLGINFYKELCVETKDEKTQKWENLNKYRNESWDLLVYCLAALLHRNVHWAHIQWDNPPTWAAEWDDNDMVFRVNDESSPFEEEETEMPDLAKLGALLG